LNGLPAGSAGSDGSGVPARADHAFRPVGQPGPAQPVQSTLGCFEASKGCTSLLVSLLCKQTGLNAYSHACHAGRERLLARAVANERRSLDLSAASSPATQKQMERARETGTWLTTMPNCLNGTVLSMDNFQDCLRLQLGLLPIGLPDGCNRYGQCFSLGHAMSCKKGGLVMLGHNDVAAE
jgi:hypothetical protein